ncbi:MAG: tetratricopeptide repeat protein [bacterium]
MIKTILLLAVSFLFLSLFAVKSYALPYSTKECFDHISAQSFKTARTWGIRAVNDRPNSFYAHLCLGETDQYLGLYKPALYDFKQAIPLANDKSRLMIVYNWIGMVFHSVGNKKDALMYDFRSLKLARELNNTSLESDDISNIAGIYSNEGKYQKALRYEKKSLLLRTTKKGKAIDYNNIAMDYSDMNNYPEAIKYQKKALILNENIGDYYGTASSFLNLGSLYTYAKNYIKAKRYILKGISMEKKIGNKDWIGAGYRYLGRLYRNEGHNKKALSYYQKAYNMFKISGDSSLAQDCLFMISKIKNGIKNQAKNSIINECFSELTKHNYKLASIAGKRAVANYPKSFYAYLCYGRAYDGLKNYSSAINNFKLAVPFATNNNRLAIIYNWIGGDYAFIKNYKAGLPYLTKSFKLAKKTNNTTMELNDIPFIKGIYYREKNYKEDIYYSKQYASLLKDKKDIAHEYDVIGVLYFDIVNYPKSIDYDKKAYMINSGIKNYAGASIDILNAGNSYIKLKKYVEAKKDILNGISIAKRAGNKKDTDYDLAYGYQNFGSLYNHLKNNQKAVFYYTKAYNLYNDIKDVSDTKYCLSMINKIKKYESKDKKK